MCIYNITKQKSRRPGHQCVSLPLKSKVDMNL
uniref:Uncharacterized protein n=1 Tax=Arundo donax TaxID=35708 RepID=A0A0A9CFN8_ARUDO